MQPIKTSKLLPKTTFGTVSGPPFLPSKLKRWLILVSETSSHSKQVGAAVAAEGNGVIVGDGDIVGASDPFPPLPFVLFENFGPFFKLFGPFFKLFGPFSKLFVLLEVFDCIDRTPVTEKESKCSPDGTRLKGIMLPSPRVC
jgi:hypothetical protein